jgi:hypothetical protein
MPDEQQDHISNLGNIAEKLIDAYLLMVQLDAEWNGTDNFETEITQESIDNVPSFNQVNLLKNNLTEVNYVNSQLMALIAPRIAHFLKLKNLP